MSAREVGKGTRFITSLQVAAACLMAFAVAFLVIDLADRKYVRLDLSRGGRNTLDPELTAVIERLPQPAQVDIFFRPLGSAYRSVSLEAQARMLEFLFTASNARRDQLEIELYDDADLERTRARQEVLGVEGTNRIVVSCGDRKTTIELFGGAVSIDWGNPTPKGVRYLTEQGIGGVIDPSNYNPNNFRPARVIGFRGQEVFAEALLKVASAKKPRVLFTEGHGEPDPHGTLSTDVGRLRQALERDGFQVGKWDGEDGDIPPDTEVLLALGTRQPFQDREREAILAYLDGGGRMIAAPGDQEIESGLEGGVAGLLFRFGMIAEWGIVCEPVTDALGRSIDGYPENARLVVAAEELSPSHRLTEAHRRRGLRLEFILSHSFRRGGVGSGGLLLDLIHSSRDSWRDLAGADGRPDFRFDDREERRARQRLVMLADLPGGVPEDGGTIRKGRVLGVASTNFFADGSFDTNRDFLLSAVNYMAEREELVRVRPRSLIGSRLDVTRGKAKPILSGTFLLGLPALLAFVGLFLGWRRRR